VTGTVTATATPTIAATGTRTPTPVATGTPITCTPGSGNLCSGIVVVRAFIDYGCDAFYNPGTDYPLFGTTVTATLPDGSTRTAVVDENGNATISGINLNAAQSITVTVSDPPSPTWVQQFGYRLSACPNSPMTVTVPRSSFTTFGTAFVDFRFVLTQ